MSTAARLEGWLARQSEHPLRWLVAMAILLAAQISPWWLPTPDSAAYLSIARSIATDHALRMFGYLHSAYPPVYPILLSPAFCLGPEPFLAISMLQCLMALILMASRWRQGIRAALDPLGRLAVIAVIAPLNSAASSTTSMLIRPWGWTSI